MNAAMMLHSSQAVGFPCCLTFCSHFLQIEVVLLLLKIQILQCEQPAFYKWRMIIMKFRKIISNRIYRNLEKSMKSTKEMFGF
jgi:hypothetical protein